MKQYILLLVAVFLFSLARGQQLSSAEYYFDTDPGVGNGTALTVITGDSIMFSGNISTAGLSNGFHFLYIRAKNTNGKWGLKERRMFHIRTITPAATLSAAEYFFDTDPGVGNGTALIVPSGDSIMYSGNISTASLIDGFHFLYVRAKDASGHWGMKERRMFFIRTLITASPLSAAEYFVDTDPGVGNGTTLTVTGNDSIVFSGNIPTTSLSTGFHFLYIRAKGTDNKWGMKERRMFYISNPPFNPPALIAAEYFVNVDPGLGNATPITVTGGDSIVFSGPFALTDTALGLHHLYIRVKDLSGVWSLYEPRTFEITPDANVHEINRESPTVLFQNYPNPFSSSTVIEFYLHKASDVSIDITDFLGRQVKTISYKNLLPGNHSMILDDALAEGYYFYRMIAGNFADTKQMVVIKK